MSVNFDLEKRILHILLIKSYNFPNLGLLSGRVGISLFFMHYSVKTKNPVFKNYAFDILDKIAAGVSQYTPLGLDSGLAGIGWGVEYLLKNKYLEGQGVDICEAIDERIMQTDPRRINDLSFETGLEGLLHYILIHLQGAITKKTVCPFDSTYLDDIYTTVCTLPLVKLSDRMIALVESYKCFYESRERVHYNVDLSTFIEKINVDNGNIKAVPIGLRNGLAGYLFNSLFVS